MERGAMIVIAMTDAMREVLLSTLSGFVSGIATALVWAGIAWAYTAMRNRQQESQIRKSLQQVGLSEGSMRTNLESNDRIKYFALVIYNETDVALVIRSVDLALSGTRLGLTYYDRAKALDEQRAEPQKRHGFVEIDPWTNGLWGFVDARLLPARTRAMTVHACRIELQYQSLLGSPRKIEVTIPAREGDSVSAVWALIAEGDD